MLTSRAPLSIVVRLALVAAIVLLSLAVIDWSGGAPTAGADGKGGVETKVGAKRLTVQGTIDSFKNFLSAPGWLQAEGLDPRRQERPAWDVLTRLRWRDLQSQTFSGFGSPSQQGGGGLLVPFRDPAPAFSRNVLISRDFSNTPVQLEPHLAVDPTDPDHIVVGIIDYNFPSIVAYVTFDGGENWEGPNQLPFIREDRIGGGDPVVAFDRTGKVYMASLSIGVDEFSVGRFATSAQVSSVAVSVSEDGGLSWSDPVAAAKEIVVPRLEPPDASLRVRGQINAPFLDKPWLDIGPHPEDPSRDVVYASYTQFVNVVEVVYLDEIPTFATVEVQTTIRLVYSEDGGETWSEPISVSPTVRRSAGDAPAPGGGVAVGLKRVVQGSEPHVAPDGTVYVSWMDSTDDDSQEGLAEVYVARSDDGGKSFLVPVRVSLFREPGFRPRTAFFRYWGSAFPKVDVGPGGEVYLVYVGLNAVKKEDDGDVFFTRSFDKGETWTRPTVLGGDDSQSLQFFPAIAVGPEGNLHVMWGDMRDDPAQIRYHVYYTTSDDRGDTWGFELEQLDLKTDDTRVTDFPSNANKGFPNGLFIGDYFAIDATADEVYMVWADTRLGEFGPFNQKVGFARKRAIPTAEVFISPPTGPGGQEITVQGFNLQPDLNVFIQVGGVTVSSERINKDGRFTSRLFMPVTGEGAQTIRIVDESGNIAGTSFFTEFGFGNIRDQTEELGSRIRVLTEREPVSGPDIDQLKADVVELRRLLEQGEIGDSRLPWWVIFASSLGGTVIAGGVLVAAFLLARRGGMTPSPSQEE